MRKFIKWTLAIALYAVSMAIVDFSRVPFISVLLIDIQMLVCFVAAHVVLETPFGDQLLDWVTP